MVALRSAAAQQLRAPLLRSVFVLLLVLGGLLFASLAGPPPARAVSGQLVWASTFSGLVTGSYDLYAASPGPGGTMYAAGGYGVNGNAGDFLVQRYRTTSSPGGPILWTTRWDNAAFKQRDTASAVLTDSSGNAVVVGESFASPTSREIAVLKVSPSGQILWSTLITDFADNRFGGAGLDAAGNVYVADQLSFDNGVTSTWYVARVQGSSGKVLSLSGWPALDGTGAPTSLTVTPTGTCYLTGWVAAPGKAPRTAVWVDPAGGGNLSWQRIFKHTDPKPRTDLGAKLVLQGKSLYVATQWVAKSGVEAAVLARFSPAGKLFWVRTWPGIKGNVNTEVDALAADGLGNAVVGGMSRTTIDYGKGYVASWSPAGKLRWVRATWDSTPGAQEAHVNALVADARGDVWAAGQNALVPGNSDAWLMKLSPAGRILWQTVYSGSGQATDRFRTAALWGKNAVFAVGVTDSGTGQDALATRYVK